MKGRTRFPFQVMLYYSRLLNKKNRISDVLTNTFPVLNIFFLFQDRILSVIYKLLTIKDCV